MPETLVRDVSPSEFFHEEITRAMRRQRVSTSAFTECYLVSLLSACLRADALPAAEPGFSETPLAILYARALELTPADEESRQESGLAVMSIPFLCRVLPFAGSQT